MAIKNRKKSLYRNLVSFSFLFNYLYLRFKCFINTVFEF